jgi:hypothetical protein
MKLIAYLVFLLWSLPGFSQEYPMLHFTFEDGLPSNTIYQVYRDSKGFLWIGTDKGIARYNGIKFEVFTIFDGLPDNEIYFFMEDYEHRLWLATSNGKLCFYQNEVFHTAENTPFLKVNFEKKQIVAMTLEPDSSLTVHYNDMTFLVNIDRNRIKTIDLNNIKVPHLFGGFYKRKLSKNRYWVYGRSSDYIVDTFCNIISENKRVFDIKLRMTFLSQNQLCIVNDKFIYNMDFEVIRPISNAIFNKYYIYNVNYYEGDYFFCTNKGLYMNDSVCVLNGMDVSSITQDNFGNYWVSTLSNGIYYLSKDFFQTRVYNAIYTGNIAYCKIQGGHIYYVNSENNLCSFYNGELKNIFNYEKYLGRDFIRENKAASYLDNNYRFYNFHDSSNIVIDNILSAHPKINKYKHDIFLWGMKSIITDSNGLYVISRNIITKINYEKPQRKGYIDYTFLLDSFARERIYSISKDKNRNVVWYITANNVFTIQNSMPVLQKQFKNVSLKAFDFLGDYMVGYTFNNELLLISNIYGAINIDSISSVHCVWNKLHKLNDSVMLISTSDFDRLLTLHSGSKVKYSLSVIEDPLVPLNIDALYSDSSSCYFFKNGAVTILSMKSLLKKNDPPKLFFTILKTNKKHYYINDRLDISYNEAKNLTVSFTAHSFMSKKVSYQYSVSKTGNDIWHSVEAKEINLLNPGYGDYVVKISAKTLGSDYSTPVMFKIHISKPYWATWWFIGLCVVAAMAVILFCLRLRILFIVRKNKKEHEREMKFVKSEYKALNALMNPHFIFNTLNNVQSLFNANDKLAANEYLRIFADLIRQNMHNVSKDVIPLQRELTLIMNYLMLEKLRFEDKLNYVINVDEGIDTSEFMVPPLLIQPLVENAIKHGILPMKERGGTVAINVTERDNMLYIEVKDDGVGMNRTPRASGIMHESFGMENIKKRIEQLSIIQGKQFTFAIHEVNDENGGHLWTLATVCMPIS